jgi:hypothetical protein
MAIICRKGKRLFYCKVARSSLVPLIPDNPSHPGQNIYQSDNIYSVLTLLNVKSGLRLEKGKSEECKESSL